MANKGTKYVKVKVKKIVSNASKPNKPKPAAAGGEPVTPPNVPGK